MPAGVEKICIISGGTEWEEFNDRSPDNILNGTSGIACVILRNLYHLLINLSRPLWDSASSYAVLDESSPAILEISTQLNTIENLDSFVMHKHKAFNILTSGKYFTLCCLMLHIIDNFFVSI